MSGQALDQRRRGRAVLAVFIVAALTVMAVPRIWAWWATRDVCPSTVAGHGRTPRGMDWTINRSDCGGEVGTVFQVRLIAPGGVSEPVYTARGWPVPVRVEQAGEEAVEIILDRPPVGETSDRVLVHVDYKARTREAPEFVAGVRKR